MRPTLSQSHSVITAYPSRVGWDCKGAGHPASGLVAAVYVVPAPTTASARKNPRRPLFGERRSAGVRRLEG